MTFGDRIDSIVADVVPGETDAYLITNLVNVRYLTGFSGTNAQLLVTKNGATFLTDPRYEQRARALVSGVEIVIYPARLTQVLADLLGGEGVATLGVEAATMTVAQLHDMRRALPDVKLQPSDNLVESMRRCKEPEEIAALKEAVRIGDEAFTWALDRIVVGMAERELALDLEIWMRKAGADEVSFPPIVGSGPQSAHIHHTPTDRAFEKGDLVLLDFGCRVRGYCSDLTRTVGVGPISDERRDVYRTVLEAQRAGIEAVRAGVAAAEVDAAARRVIADAGLGDRFGHGLGHGVGLEVHEAPTLKGISDDELRAGDVVTIEPGVYVPGDAGIRIEDCVLVTETGAEVLGAAPKDDLTEL